MLRRTLLTAATATLAARAPAHAQAGRRVTFIATTTDVSPGHAPHSSLPQALGYWAAEGLAVDFYGVDGSTAAVQQIAGGNADIAAMAPESMILARERNLPLTAYYNYARRSIYRVLVPQDSPIRDAAALRGKTIGVPGMAAASVPFARGLVASAGLDPAHDVRLLVVGLGAQAAEAISSGTVDAYAAWDTAQAALENRGMALRDLTVPPFTELMGPSLVATDRFLRDRRADAVGIARGIAKATVFAMTNPEAAIRLHWRTFPQTRPTGITDQAAALREAMHVALSRFRAYEVEGRPATPFGSYPADAWPQVLRVYGALGLVSTRLTPDGLFTRDLLEEVNRFDADAIAASARDYVVR